MGARRLKKKDDLNYRRGPTSGGCSECNHYKEHPIYAIGGYLLRQEKRCMVMGLGNSIKYRIHPANICDAFDNSRLLERLGAFSDKWREQ